MVARIFALFAFVFALASCQWEAAPPLVQVLDVTPRDAELGDRLEIIGEGFPLGRTARITFRGSLHRPGESSVPRAEISTEATVTSPQHLELSFGENLESLFCGVGDRAAHTTFQGHVEVAFAAAAPGAPPVSGSLGDVTLDFRPKGVRRAVLDGQLVEGRRTLAFLGVSVADALPSSGGLVVETVAAGSKAEAAGIGAGDVLARFDGVRVLSVADVVPSGEEGRARVVVRRADGVREDALTVSLEGYEPRAPSGLMGSAVFLTVAIAVVLLFFAPTAGALSWIERRVVEEAHRAGGWKRRLALGRFAPALLLGVSVPFLVLPLAASLLAADVDVGVLYLLALGALTSLGVLSSASLAKGKARFVLGLRTLVRLLGAEVPRAIAVASVVLMTGSLRLSEIVRAQGAFPWEWYVFVSPIGLALFLLFVGTALASDPPPPALLPEAEGPRKAPFVAAFGAPGSSLAVAEQAHLFLMCGLGAALFLGGWQLPFLGPGEQDARPVLELAGGFVFLLKAWLLVLVVVGMKVVVPTVHEGVTLSWKVLAPLAVVAFVLTAAWVTWSPSRSVQLVISRATCAACVLALIVFAARVRQSVRSHEGRVHLNPFL